LTPLWSGEIDCHGTNGRLLLAFCNVEIGANTMDSRPSYAQPTWIVINLCVRKRVGTGGNSSMHDTTSMTWRDLHTFSESKEVRVGGKITAFLLFLSRTSYSSSSYLAPVLSSRYASVINGGNWTPFRGSMGL
jgi:hypothetical protein